MKIVVAIVEEHAVESFMLGVPDVDHEAGLETAIRRHSQWNHLKIQIEKLFNLQSEVTSSPHSSPP